MLNEKVVVVQILLAKICAKVHDGYSKSIDKIKLKIKEVGNKEVLSYIDTNEMQNRRFLIDKMENEEGKDEEEGKEEKENKERE